jgi:hypothetical protein
MIKITIDLKEVESGLMTLRADSEAVEPVTKKEYDTFVVMSKKIAAMIQEIATAASHSVYAEGDSANRLFDAINKKEEGDKDGG